MRFNINVELAASNCQYCHSLRNGPSLNLPGYSLEAEANLYRSSAIDELRKIDSEVFSEESRRKLLRECKECDFSSPIISEKISEYKKKQPQ